MTTDVDMTDAKDKDKDKEEAADQKPSGPVLGDVLKSNLKLIDKAVATREARLLFGRLLRQTATVRSQFSGEALGAFVKDTLAEDSRIRPCLLKAAEPDAQVCKTNIALSIKQVAHYCLCTCVCAIKAGFATRIIPVVVLSFSRSMRCITICSNAFAKCT